MAIINKNNFGTIVVNNRVLTKMVIEDLLKMNSMFILCNKKGKKIKDKPTPFIDPDYYDAIDVSETTKNGLCVLIYLIAKSNYDINYISQKIFSVVEENFLIFNVHKPDLITLHYKGILDNSINKANFQVRKRNKN